MCGGDDVYKEDFRRKVVGEVAEAMSRGVVRYNVRYGIKEEEIKNQITKIKNFKEKEK